MRFQQLWSDHVSQIIIFCYADPGRVLVMTSDGRIYVGVLKACDQATNLVLDQTIERVYSSDVSPSQILELIIPPRYKVLFWFRDCLDLQEGVKSQQIGLYVLRGDHVYVSRH